MYIRLSHKNNIFEMQIFLIWKVLHCLDYLLVIVRTCMEVNSSDIMIEKNIDLLYVAWRKFIRNIWKISPRTHCSLLSHINNCDPIENVTERRCIKFILNLLNSDCKL